MKIKKEKFEEKKKSFVIKGRKSLLIRLEERLERRSRENFLFNYLKVKTDAFFKFSLLTSVIVA